MSDRVAVTTKPKPAPVRAATAAARPSRAGYASPKAQPTLGEGLQPEPRLDLPAPEVGVAVATAALLADRTRAGILRMLAEGPHCVCELAAALDERQNNVSMHLARLRDAGLVRQARHAGDARWVYYERDETAITAACAAIREVLG